MKKEQLKLENQRKLLEKLLFMTICPEFNDGGVTEAVSIVLFKFLWLSNFYSCFGGFADFVSVFWWFPLRVSVVSVVPVVSYRWFRSGVSSFSTCQLNFTVS